jgi:hypothetical protein
VICDRPKNIRKQVSGELVQLIPEDWEKAQAILKALPGVLELQTYGEYLNIMVDDADKCLLMVKKAFEKLGVGYRGLRAAPMRMEEAFISIIRRLEESAAPLEKVSGDLQVED